MLPGTMSIGRPRVWQAGHRRRSIGHSGRQIAVLAWSRVPLGRGVPLVPCRRCWSWGSPLFAANLMELFAWAPASACRYRPASGVRGFRRVQYNCPVSPRRPLPPRASSFFVPGIACACCNIRLNSAPGAVPARSSMAQRDKRSRRAITPDGYSALHCIMTRL